MEYGAGYDFIRLIRSNNDSQRPFLGLPSLGLPIRTSSAPSPFRASSVPNPVPLSRTTSATNYAAAFSLPNNQPHSLNNINRSRLPETPTPLSFIQSYFPSHSDEGKDEVVNKVFNATFGHFNRRMDASIPRLNEIYARQDAASNAAHASLDARLKEIKTKPPEPN